MSTATPQTQRCVDASSRCEKKLSFHTRTITENSVMYFRHPAYSTRPPAVVVVTDGETGRGTRYAKRFIFAVVLNNTK